MQTHNSKYDINNPKKSFFAYYYRYLLFIYWNSAIKKKYSFLSVQKYLYSEWQKEKLTMPSTIDFNPEFIDRIEQFLY